MIELTCEIERVVVRVCTTDRPLTTSVCDTELGGGVGGAPDDASTELWATCTAQEDTEKGFFYLKMKDNTLGAAIQYLREKGLFHDEDSDDEEEENPAADFEW